MWNTDHVPSFSSCKVVTIGQDGLKYCQMPKGSRDANRTTCLPSLSAAAAMTRMTMGWQGTWHETTKASVSHHCPPPLSNPFQIKKNSIAALQLHMTSQGVFGSATALVSRNGVLVQNDGGLFANSFCLRDMIHWDDEMIRADQVILDRTWGKKQAPVMA